MNVPTPKSLEEVDAWIEQREEYSFCLDTEDRVRQYTQLTPHTRGWIPFKQAREFVRSLSLSTAAEYRAWLRGERPDLPPRPKCLPTNPDQAYQKFGWSGYTDYLTTPSYHGNNLFVSDTGIWPENIDPAQYGLKPSTYEKLRLQAARLVYYYRLNGHCRVRLRDPIWKPLAKQLERLRSDYKQGNGERVMAFVAMLPEKVTPFDTGSPISPPEYRSVHVKAWGDKYDELQLFKQIFGHARIPLKPWPHKHPIIPLASWANQQRVRVKNGTIRDYQVKLLQEIGFQTHGQLHPVAPLIEQTKLDLWVKAVQHRDV